MDSTALLERLGVKAASGKDVGREVRRFLSDAYSFVQGEASNEEAKQFGLAQAIAGRIAEIEGIPPFQTKKKNLIDRIDYLVEKIDVVVAGVIAMDVEDLSEDALSGFTDGGVSNYLSILTGESVGSSYPDISDYDHVPMPKGFGDIA